MPLRNDNGGRGGGPWASGAKPGSDLEDLVRHGQDRLKRLCQDNPMAGERGRG
jgi:hypothetical protein